MLRRVLAVALSLGMVLCAIPSVSAAGATGQISGTAMRPSGEYLAGQIARLRSLDLGHVADVTTTSGSGGFSFAGVSAGTYIVELVSNGTVVGTSTPVTLSVRSMTAEGLRATALATPAAAQAQTYTYSDSFWKSKWGIISLAAIATGATAAVVVAKDDASASR